MAIPVKVPTSILAGSLESWAYLDSYKDLDIVARANGLPLTTSIAAADSAWAAAHYTNFGKTEGRAILFDAAEYLASNVDLITAFGPLATGNSYEQAEKLAAQHYFQYGYAETSRPTSTSSVGAFNATTYLTQNADLAKAYNYTVGSVITDAQAALAEQHFTTFGYLESRPGTGVAAGTFILTTGVDTGLAFTGTSGNDVFIADNTNALAHTSSAADTLTSGGGTDTLKIYSDGLNADALPTLVGDFNLWINNQGIATPSYAANTSIKSVQLDAPTFSDTLTVKGQAVAFSNESAGGLAFTVASATDTTENVTFSAVGKSTAHDSLDFSGVKVTSATITSTGGSNFVDITNTGLKLTALSINGDKAFTSIIGAGLLPQLKSIDASASTGAVTIAASAAAVTADFSFTGGSGVTSLTLLDAGLLALNAGSQLDGGTGTANVFSISDLAYAFTAADYTALNAVKDFQIFKLADGDSIVASSLTSALKSHFSLAGDATLTKLATGGTVDVLALGAKSTFTVGSTGAGIHTLNLNIGTATTGGLDFVIGAGVDTVTGWQVIDLHSLGTNAAANIINLVNDDNVTINVTGTNDLTLGLAAGATSGSQVDAHAFTGTLVLTDSGKGDTILAGSGTTTINETALTNLADDITLLAGHTKVNTLVLGAAGNVGMTPDTVTNFVLNQDKIQGGVALAVGTELSAVHGISANVYADASAFISAADVVVPTAANDTIAWYDSANNNTYVVDFTGAGPGSEHVVELIGVHASGLTTTSHAGYVVLA